MLYFLSESWPCPSIYGSPRCAHLPMTASSTVRVTKLRPSQTGLLKAKEGPTHYEQGVPNTHIFACCMLQSYIMFIMWLLFCALVSLDKKEQHFWYCWNKHCWKNTVETTPSTTLFFFHLTDLNVTLMFLHTLHLLNEAACITHCLAYIMWLTELWRWFIVNTHSEEGLRPICLTLN